MKTLALPTKLETAVQPPPTKAEIITAMVAVRIEKHELDQKAKVARREQLQKEVEPLIREYALINSTKLRSYVRTGSQKKDYVDGNYIKRPIAEDVELRIDCGKLPKDLNAMLLEMYSLPTCIQMLDAKRVKAEITEKLNGIVPTEKRVQEMLTNKESREGLEKMLKHIGL